MNKIETFGYRGNTNILNELMLELNSKKIPLSLNLKDGISYNFRFVFEFVEEKLMYSNELLGKPIFGKELIIENKTTSKLGLNSLDDLIKFKTENNLEVGTYYVGINIYEEIPIHSFGVLETIPIPKNIATVHIHFSKKKEFNYDKGFAVQKYFDGYSHLGFLIVDLPKMKNIIEAEYGDKQLDLVYEFSNTEIIEKLFQEEIIALIWGINPFTYPLYSTDNVEALKPLLGEKFKDEGVFNLKEDIEFFSIIPGYDLKNWHSILKKEYPKIKIYGKGKTVHLSPYALIDSDKSITTTSFLLHRSKEILKEAKPLLNIDLLYDKTVIG